MSYLQVVQTFCSKIATQKKIGSAQKTKDVCLDYRYEYYSKIFLKVIQAIYFFRQNYPSFIYIYLNFLVLQSKTSNGQKKTSPSRFCHCSKCYWETILKC